MDWVRAVRSYEGEGEAISPSEETAQPKVQPDIGQAKAAWTAEATRTKLVEGPQDAPGVQQLKRLLGTTCTSLVPGCNAYLIQTEGPNVIWVLRGDRKAA